MTERRTSSTADPPSVLVASHICLDIIPGLPSGPQTGSPKPGSLDPLGPVTLAVGGCVGNTGIAPHRLGMRSTLVARVGDDRLGAVLSALLRDAVRDGAARLTIAAGEPTSYSIVSNLPSLAEASHLLRRSVHRDEHGGPTLKSVARLADEMIGLGVGIAGVKLGEHGLYVRTASAARLAVGSADLSPTWANRELYSSVFETNVVGTAGAGDTTISGFLFGLLMGMSPSATVTWACAVGGSSTEAADGTSGVPSWPEIERRLQDGWRRKAATPGLGWSPSREHGLWHGPRDAVGPAA